MNIHIRCHSGEKLFACTVCDKWFSQTGRLKRHQLLHSGEKLFCCTVCDKSFSWRDISYNTLERRIFPAVCVTSNSPKLATWTMCDKSFSEACDLKRHQHHGEKPFRDPTYPLHIKSLWRIICNSRNIVKHKFKCAESRNDCKYLIWLKTNQ